MSEIAHSQDIGTPNTSLQGAAQREAAQAKVAIVGATGYGGAELLRTLCFHPRVQVVRAVAIDNVGKSVGEVHPNLAGLTSLVIEEMPVVEAAQGMDAVFFALPHKTTARFVQALLSTDVRIVDLSGDFRLKDSQAYEAYYGAGHPCPEAAEQFVYGLPELNRKLLQDARRIASPGCFATTIELALLPVARAGWLQGPARVVAITGSSGSGAEPRLTTHHPLREGNLRTYKPLTHQHVPEIEAALFQAGAGPGFGLQFVPVSAPLVRGIFATAYVDVPASVTAADVHAAFAASFEPEPFVRYRQGYLPEVNAIKGSMFVDVGWELDPTDRAGSTRTLACFAALDNLVKGGAGQAVQSFNVSMGWPDALGLNVPALWP
jgi:N-acetyl-gamma-glutamyl-phosphate reductase